MITTAVHQASQMVEIQGAPPPAPASADDFRATFAASVGDSAVARTGQNNGQTGDGTATASGGTASSKHVVVAGLLAKAPSLAASATSQVRQKLRSAGPVGGAVVTSAENSVLNLKASSDPALKSAVTAGAGIETHDVVGDAGSATAAQLSDDAQVKGPGAAILPLPFAASGSDATVETAKGLPAVQSSGIASARGHKEEASVLGNKDAVAAPAKDTGMALPVSVPNEAVVTGQSLADATPAVPVGQLDTTVLGQVPEARTTDGVAIAQKGTKQGVLTSVLPTAGDAGDIAGAGLNELASMQQDLLAAPFAAELTRATGKASGVASEVTGTGVKGGSQGDLVTASLEPAASTSLASITGSAAAAAPVARSTSRQPLAGSMQAKSVSAANDVEAKLSATFEATEAAGVTQARATAQPRPASVAQPRISSQPVSLKTPGAVSAQLSAEEDRGSASSAAAASAVEAATGSGGPGATAPEEVKPAQEAKALRDVPVGAVPLTETSSRTVTAPVKDERTKTIAAGSDDAVSTQPTSAQTLSGDASSGTANLAAAANATARVVSVADAAVPVSAVTANIAVPFPHTAAAVSGPADSARAAGSVNAGMLAEPTSSIAQVAEPHRTLLATPTTLEVGVPSGTQGWLRIRAEVGAPGEVNASLSAASSGGRELLHNQMPALNAFLHSEQLAVTTTVVERVSLSSGGPASGGMGGDTTGGSNASLLQGGGAGSDGSQRDAQQTANFSVSEKVTSYDARAGVSDAAGQISNNASLAGESGRWLNVRA